METETLTTGPRRAGRSRPSFEDVQRFFGENYRDARLKAGMTQRDIEDNSGIRQHSLSLIESGRANPQLETMWRLAEVLGVDLQELLRPRHE